MYVGRIVALGASAAGNAAVVYRVSSRSYGNRQAVPVPGGIAIVPKVGHEADALKSPYIAYTGLRTTERHAVVSNGTHTDIIANKLADGASMRDALSQVLVAMDFEHDSLDTPRIAAVVEPREGRGYLGVVTRRSLHVQPFELEAGHLRFLTTYEVSDTSPGKCSGGFLATTAGEACDHILTGGAFAGLSHPVSAAAAMWKDSRWDVDCANMV